MPIGVEENSPDWLELAFTAMLIVDVEGLTISFSDSGGGAVQLPDVGIGPLLVVGVVALFAGGGSVCRVVSADGSGVLQAVTGGVGVLLARGVGVLLLVLKIIRFNCYKNRHKTA